MILDSVHQVRRCDGGGGSGDGGGLSYVGWLSYLFIACNHFLSFVCWQVFIYLPRGVYKSFHSPLKKIPLSNVPSVLS